jgi:hypothetical protein
MERKRFKKPELDPNLRAITRFHTLTSDIRGGQSVLSVVRVWHYLVDVRQTYTRACPYLISVMDAELSHTAENRPQLFVEDGTPIRFFVDPGSVLGRPKLIRTLKASFFYLGRTLST